MMAFPSADTSFLAPAQGATLGRVAGQRQWLNALTLPFCTHSSNASFSSKGAQFVGSSKSLITFSRQGMSLLLSRFLILSLFSFRGQQAETALR